MSEFGTNQDVGDCKMYVRMRITPPWFPRMPMPRVSGLLGALVMMIYLVVVIDVYAVAAMAWIMVTTVRVLWWLGAQAWLWIQRRRAELAAWDAAKTAYRAELSARADEQNADFLAGGTGLPEAPLPEPMRRPGDPAPRT